MNQDTEKALLEFVAGVAQWTTTGAKTLGEYGPLARAYLATLEPKPERKRGVEEILRGHIAWLETVSVRKGNWSEHGGHFVSAITEALRLYREERERVARLRDELRQKAGTQPTFMLVATAHDLTYWADELERRDAD